MILPIILAILSYLFIGGLLAGFVLYSWGDDVGEYVLVIGGWPIILTCLVLYGIVIGPIKLGEIIRERIEKM